MNTRPPNQHEVLDQEEREFARIVRALPGGDPPAALDALILKSASDAVASHTEKKSRWSKGLLGTSALWIGTAAASILTVGIGWQVFQSMSAPIYELPDDQNIVSAPQVDDSHKSDAITVEMMPASPPSPTSPPPPDEFSTASVADAAKPSAQPMKPQPSNSGARAKESAARQEMAAASLAKTISQAQAQDERSRELTRSAENDWVPQAAGAVAPVAAPPPPAANMAEPLVASAPAHQTEDSKKLDTVTVTGSRIRRAESEAEAQAASTDADIIEASVARDAKLSPEHWLDAIESRMRAGDIDGAKASLKLFRKKHPKLLVPEELKPLLK